MQNATINQCSSGFFYDSGGEFGNAGNDENLTLTLCPDTPGLQAQLNFTQFALQNNLDFLTIYNGPDITYDEIVTSTGVVSPGLITASLTEINPGGLANPDGCLTIVYTSNSTGPSQGWIAEISCFEPCQTIDAVIANTTPVTNSEDIIRICQGQEVTFEGDGVFSSDSSGAQYEWDFGDGTSATGQVVSKVYNDEGIYIVNLVVSDDNPAGCSSSNLLNQFVHVSTNPDFTGTQAVQNTICYGESVDISGQVDGVTFAIDCANGGVQANLGSTAGQTYNSTLELDCFLGQTLSDPSQLESICIVMEHTYIGDLDIIIQSPSGQQVALHDETGGGTFLGNPIISDGTGPGQGWEYCFSMSGTNLLSNSPTIPGGTPTPGNSVDPDSGPFLPVGDFNSFVGTEINGEWTLIIVDNLNIDDGTVFTWSLNFDESLIESDFAFTPIIDNEGWDSNPTIVNTNSNVITVAPPDAGQYTYTYRAFDDFGCEYSQEVTVEVLPELIAVAPNNLVICDPGAAPYIFDLELNTPVVTASASNAGDLVVTYHNSQTDAENDAGAISGTNNYSGTDGETIFVRVEYLTSGCNEVFPFTLNLSGQPVINPVSALELCDDSSNDGFEEFNLNAQTAGILGGQDASSFEVTYHLSFADADADVAALPLNYTNTANPQPIFVRIETIGDSSCYNASSNPLFNLVVIPREDATFNVTPTCDGATVNTPLATPGGVFEFTGFPGPGVSIDPTTGEVTGATSGLPYEVRYTTSGVCPSVFTLTFNVLTEDNATFNVTPTCDGGTASITGDSGGIFSFNPVPTDTAVIDSSTGDVTNATPGTSYTIEYMTSGACPASSTQVLTVLNLDDPSFSLTATCDGATATIAGDTGGTFAFNPAPTDAAVIDVNTGTITSGASGATYSVEYTTANSCPQSSIEAVTVLDSDDASFTVAPTCNGGVVTITGTVGGIFGFDTVPTDTAVIDSNTGEVTNASSGATYSISYTTLGVCPDTEVVTFNALPIDDASFIVNPTCDGGETTITGITGGTFSFDVVPTDLAVIDTNTGDVTNGTPGETYTIEYVTFGACPNSSIVVFTANPLPSLVVPTALAVCDDGVPDGLTEIDLSIKNEEISGNNPLYSVSYYLTPGDADTA
ncbi:PKD domain-containing protein, partial [Winogradskyella flava]|uniref:PKD domain-containing protein n=1 Tax=Winogradskyella flava TaxID=1884876 RepID=UPI002491635B